MGYGPLAHFKGPSSFWARIIPGNIPRLLYHIRWKNTSEYKGFRMISISCISFITHILKRRKSFCEPLLIQLQCMDPVGGGVWTPQPSENHKAIGFLGNRGDIPKYHKATEPAFTVGPSSARQQDTIKMVFRWQANDGPLVVVFGSSLPSSTKNNCQSWTPFDKTFWICACNFCYSCLRTIKQKFNMEITKVYGSFIILLPSKQSLF